MTVGAETLFERIHTVKCINQALSKGYERLTDRMSLQEGNMHAIKIYQRMKHYLYWTDFISWNAQ